MNSEESKPIKKAVITEPTLDLSGPAPEETFVSKYSGDTFPVSQKVDIPNYGPISQQEASVNISAFVRLADQPADTKLYYADDTFPARAGIYAAMVRVSKNSTWPIGGDGITRIDPACVFVAVNSSGVKINFHSRYKGDYFLCRETCVYFSSVSSVRFIEDVNAYVSRRWLEDNTCEYKYFCCEECGNWYTWSARSTDDPDDEDICRSCADARGGDGSGLIDIYGDRNYPAARGANPRKYGVEMEVEVGGSIGEAAKRVVTACTDNKGRFVILKSDGSIDHGFEIVSGPMDFDTHMTVWRKYFEVGTESLKAWDTSTCGLHIHVTRDELSHLQLGKMIVFVNDPQHKKFIETVAGRDPSRWAAFRPQWKHGKSRGRDSNRYSAINLGNDNTIEFRIFRGTVRGPTLYKAIQFVDALVEYCSPCGRSLTDTTDLAQFLLYVRQHRKKYPQLDDFLVAKHFLPARKVAKDKLAMITTPENADTAPVSQ